MHRFGKLSTKVQSSKLASELHYFESTLDVQMERRLAKRGRETGYTDETRENDAKKKAALLLDTYPIPKAWITTMTGLLASTKTSKHKVNAIIYDRTRTCTPYGELTCSLDLPLEAGGTMKIELNNPFAWLHHASTLSAEFGTFLATHLCQANGALANIVLWSDETVPGNQLRPSTSRKFESVMWTFLEFPSWFLHREWGWFQLAFVPSHKLANVKGGLQTLMKHILLLFFSPTTFNFESSGVRVQTVGGGTALVKARFACFLMDEKALKIVLSVKGASGTKPCLACKNVVGAQTHPLHPDDYVVHFSDARKWKFDAHTVHSYQEMKDALDSVRHNPRELPDLEQILGLKYDPYALLWDPYIAQIVRIPECAYFDPMHCIWATGGVAQIQINAFVLATLECGLSLKDIDAFLDTIRGIELEKGFFSKRIKNRCDAHIRSFASESIDAVRVLVLLSIAILQEANELEDHVKCLFLLNDIQEILLRPQLIMNNIAALKEKLQAHHTLYATLYKCVPKNHFLRHLPDQIMRFKCLLSCFATERSHKRSKKICTFSFFKIEKTMITRCNYAFSNALLERHFLKREYLKNPKKNEIYGQMFVSNAMQTKLGHIARGDYVKVAPNGLLKVAFCMQSDDLPPLFYVIGNLHQKIGYYEWAPQEHCVAVAVSHLIGKQVVRLAGDKVHSLF